MNDTHTVEVLEIGETAPYNLNLQIGGIFVILAASALGVILPLLLYFLGVQRNPVVETTLLGVKTCGVGIIICTGFIHMLGDASSQLSRTENPDLPEIFDYEAWDSVFAIIAIFLCAVADFLVLRANQSLEDTESGAHGEEGVFTGLTNCHHHSTSHEGSHRPPIVEGKLQLSAQHQKVRATDGGDALIALENGSSSSSHNNNNNNNSNNSLMKEKDAEEPSAYLASKWRVLTLESGILVHSVLIGLDMGMQSGSSYDALLIAIAFHQFFEGFALSQILIEARLEAVWMLIVAVAFYAITTPAGIAAGIAVHSFYDEDSVSACLTMGIMDSLAGGILIYMGLTSLLSSWIVNSIPLARAHWSRPLVAFIGLALGLISMAVVGKWA